MVAEIGVDISVFPTAGHLASWAGRCPGNDQSAGKRRSGRIRKGPSGSGPRSKKPRSPGPEAATSTPNTNDSVRGSVTATRRGQTLDADRTTGTCSPPARPTTNSAATTANAATPNAPPNVSSPASQSPVTSSPSNRRWLDPERISHQEERALLAAVLTVSATRNPRSQSRSVGRHVRKHPKRDVVSGQD
jgi:hypothetical protein